MDKLKVVESKVLHHVTWTFQTCSCVLSYDEAYTVTVDLIPPESFCEALAYRFYTGQTCLYCSGLDLKCRVSGPW